MYLVCGIHGSGKTSYCRLMEQKMGIPYFSASDLINRTIKLNQIKTKKIDRIDDRQKVLISAAERIREQYKEFILDGHLCLINTEGKIERIPEEVFYYLKMSKIYLIMADEKVILDRMEKRDDINWTLDFVESFQQEELQYAKHLAQLYGVELEIVNTAEKNNIVLPIAPIYAEKILKGEKKFEFRKKIAQKDVNKIFIYATSPVKQIIGEVEVETKIVMDKNELWQITSESAGVTKEFYLKYFEGQDDACAYKLGKALTYKSGILLKDIGINYIPQSFAYICDF